MRMLETRLLLEGLLAALGRAIQSGRKARVITRTSLLHPPIRLRLWSRQPRLRRHNRRSVYLKLLSPTWHLDPNQFRKAARPLPTHLLDPLHNTQSALMNWQMPSSVNLRSPSKLVVLVNLNPCIVNKSTHPLDPLHNTQSALMS